MIYEQYFSFMGLREDPFHVSPDPRFYYSTPAHESALAELLYGIETRQGFLVLTGEAGTGKTCLLNEILDWLRRRDRSSAYIFHTHLEPIGLFRFILSEFGVPCQSKSKSDLVKALHTWLLQRHAARDLPVLILDEAQGLPLQTLEEVRLLLNLETPRGKLLQIILSGQPELDEKLRLPALRQVRQRVMFHSRLPVLTQKETAAYISSRLATAGCSDSSLFPDEVVQDIYTSSRGIPRIVNLLCEHALISAYAERQLVVSPEMIQRIAADFDLLAKPLPVIDSELQSNYVRFAPFPVIKKPMANQHLTALSWWEQIDFDVFKDLDKQTQPAVKEDPVPAVPPLAAVECPKPVARPAYASTPGRSSEVSGYWRRHRSRWAVAVFARNSAASVQRAWHAFTHPFVCYARYVRFTFFPVIEKRGAMSVANQRSTASWWAQIDFAIFKDPLAAVYKRAQAAAKEDPVLAVTPPALVESPKYWRRDRWRSVVAALGRNSAAFQRAWHAFTHPFVGYARSVSRSFVRDCRLLFRVLTLPAPALERDSSTEAANEKSAARRNVLAPVVNWLRQPVTPANISSNRSPEKRDQQDDKPQRAQRGKHWRIRKHGRRLKGPELVSVRAFNRRNRSDGIGFLQQQSFTQKILRWKSWLRLSREIESSHILVMGDSGKGKSELIRQILLQIEERGETAIVYDPATPADYVPYFLTPSRGDLILNPLDQRMPYWTPGDELRQGADALTLAASLFPDRPNENSFFVEAPRKIFAHLLSFHPTPQELAWWMSHPEEIDRRVKGTKYAAMIDRDSPPQRNGVLGSLSMVADAMKLLPSEAETKGRWSTLEWSKERRGWLFLTSTPDTRKRLAPLISLWLDMLVLRLMNQGRMSPRPVWFILDELATLQRLPQLHTAITENRKSNNPVVLGFQGRSQLEVLYGHEAEAMMSQPSTKIFLCTSEPHAAKWISDTIGEQEIERIRESRTNEQLPQSRKSKGYNLEREIRPLVVASEISGLEKMHGYLKCGNLVARMSLPYIELENKERQYIERPAQQPPEEPPKVAAAAAGAGKPSGNGAFGQKLVPNEQQQSADQKIQLEPVPRQRDFFE